MSYKKGPRKYLKKEMNTNMPKMKARGLQNLILVSCLRFMSGKQRPIAKATPHSIPQLNHSALVGYSIGLAVEVSDSIPQYLCAFRLFSLVVLQL